MVTGSINIPGIDLELRSAFRKYCVMRDTNMKDEFVKYMKDALAKAEKAEARKAAT